MRVNCGPARSTGPHSKPHSERACSTALARQLRRPAFIPAPYFGLRLVFGEFAQVLFASQRVIPKVALDSGFTFQFPEIAGALRDILSPATSAA